MPKPLIAAIDFDGTIHDYKHPLPGKKWGGPLPGAQESMRRLHGMGLEVVVFTTKAVGTSGRQAVIDWLRHHAIPFDEVTATKPAALFYLDDRAIHFSDWSEAMTAIRSVMRRV